MHSLGSYKESFHFTFQYLVFFPCVSQPGNGLLPLIIFRGPENTEEENKYFSLGEAFSSHSGPSPLSFWLKRSPDTCCQKPYIDQMQVFVWRRAFWGFLKGNEEITYCVSKKKILMEHYASLLASTSESTSCLCLDNFARSSVRFIVPRKPYQCRTALPVVWSLSNTFVLRFGLELLSLPAEPLLLPCAPGHCLYLHETEFRGLWWEKKDPGAAGRGNFGDSVA